MADDAAADDIGADGATGAGSTDATRSDDDVSVGEVVDDDLTDGTSESGWDVVEAQLDADLTAAAAEADELGQTAEEAVVEAVDLAQRMESERDELRDLLQRVKADFDNYKRRIEAQRVEQRATAAMGLVEELLPVLDACDAGLVAGHDDILPIQSQLTGTLEKRGLVRVAEVDVAFDPNVHEAVLHEEGDGDPLVVEVLRPGYLWNAHVVRPAMVKVKG